MFKHGNVYIKPKKIDYQEYLNVWVDDTKRIEQVKHLMIADKNFKLERLKTNPVYNEVYKEITIEKDRVLQKLDQSWLWSRKFTPHMFKYNFLLPFSIWSFVFIPYIFYKVLPKRIYEYHVKYGYNAETLKESGRWNIDFENKDLYPDSAIKMFFEVKKKNYYIQKERDKALSYSEKFVNNISQGYLSDFSKRRKNLGFDDDKF